MKILLLTSTAPLDADTMTPDAGRPIPDAQALTAAMASLGLDVDVISDDAAVRDQAPLVRYARRLGGPGAALAILAFRRRRQYEAIITDGGRAGTTLALLFQLVAGRPAHVCVGQDVTPAARPWLFRLLGLGRAFDTLLVYSQAARDFAEDRLGLPAERLSLMTPPVDDRFFRPPPAGAAGEAQIFGEDVAGVLQAMALGKAVVATRAEGLADIIQDGITGLVVLPGDAAGRLQALGRLRDDPVLCERLGRSARRWVEENAAQDRWAARVASAVCAAAAARASRRFDPDALTAHRSW